MTLPISSDKSRVLAQALRAEISPYAHDVIGRPQGGRIFRNLGSPVDDRAAFAFSHSHRSGRSPTFHDGFKAYPPPLSPRQVMKLPTVVAHKIILCNYWIFTLSPVACRIASQPRSPSVHGHDPDDNTPGRHDTGRNPGGHGPLGPAHRRDLLPVPGPSPYGHQAGGDDPHAAGVAGRHLTNLRRIAYVRVLAERHRRLRLHPQIRNRKTGLRPGHERDINILHTGLERRRTDQRERQWQPP